MTDRRCRTIGLVTIFISVIALSIMYRVLSSEWNEGYHNFKFISGVVDKCVVKREESISGAMLTIVDIYLKDVKPSRFHFLSKYDDVEKIYHWCKKGSLLNIDYQYNDINDLYWAYMISSRKTNEVFMKEEKKPQYVMPVILILVFFLGAIYGSLLVFNRVKCKF